MHLPSAISRISLLSRDYEAPYPPMGFHPFEECSLGNGDYFGLYWPIGKEESEPIIAEMRHDEWSLLPSFSSLDRFLAKAEHAGLNEWIESPEPGEDPESPLVLLDIANQALRQQNVQASIAALEVAVSRLPEFGAARSLLSSQYRRLGRYPDAISSALLAIISPPSLGGADSKALQWLARQKQCPENLAEDPIWQNRLKLSFRFGGTKTNDDYLILQAAVDEYRAANRGVEACTLMQCYGELMYRETVSFQERYHFSPTEFVSAQKATAARFGFDRGPISSAA
jgi:tetratricopeptide (TPR) repeat protein